MTATAPFPSMVLVIRHGEKPGNPEDDKGGGPHLSLMGSARAAALPSLFTPDPGATPQVGAQLCCEVSSDSSGHFIGGPKTTPIRAGASRFPTPNYLFATQPGGSHRPLETITPLAATLQALGDASIDTKINTDFTNDPKSIQKLAKTIIKTPSTYGGKIVLICWHHGTIPTLIQDLGVPASQLGGWQPWPPTVFDLVMQITWSGQQANLSVQYQQLLFGDTSGIVKLQSNTVAVGA